MRKVDYEDENSFNTQTKRPRSFTPLQNRPPLRVVSASCRTGAEEVDLLDGANPKAIGYYAGEIFENMLKSEPLTLPESNYMTEQPDINYKMRAILIDWLVSVHGKFRLMPETLFLCVNLVDRYLSFKEIERKYLQLVGVCALMVACKYEEIHPPRMKDFVYITDRAYSTEQLMKMEVDMLDTLKFNITVPSVLRFYERWVKVAGIGEKVACLGKYLCELALVEYHMLRYKPSLLAIAAVYLAMKIVKIDTGSCGRMFKSAKCTDGEVKVCARELLCLFQSAQSHTLTCVREKYLKKENFEAAKIKIS
ncbi:hypothetical protein SteCoe_30794 [Stentor coeruleus]|uniref:Uncharacterized protein n=1 Tax=Stentor coeruleus TaxID=5963 RepID=A0A1R2B390_9CILI|nr:hypothetical protein SteCoe_30794 [Stentor coeruleus]